MTDDRNEQRAQEPVGSDVEGPEESAPTNGMETDEGGAVAGTEVEAEVEELRGALDTLNDRHLRLAAEFDNYRKRNERDRQMLATRLQADLVSALLEVLDDLQRVEQLGAGATAESVAEGVRLVEKKFLGILEAAGLERLDVEGERFDPAVMEALMTVPTDDPERDEHVADVLQAGYRFRDVLVRPARVRVLSYEGSGVESE